MPWLMTENLLFLKILVKKIALGSFLKLKSEEVESLAKYYLVTCDQHILLIVVGEFGEHVEVFKWNDVTEEWEKTDGLGKHMIYICGSKCCVKE